jgi:hypothetical protein
MNEEYQKLSVSIDNLLSDSAKEIKMALIEKEILLEKTRKLYVQISAMETEEYEAPKSEKIADSEKDKEEVKKEFTPAKTLDEDVDLFFDTEHESYAGVEKELKELAEEIEEAQESVAAPATKTEPEPVAETDIFDQIVEEEKIEIKEDNEPMHDDAEELFEEPDIEISVEPEVEEEPHDEDDILKFIPPKSEPVKSEPPKPKPAKLEPPVVVKREEPKVEFQVQSKQQRSLNDLFNEQREDHSISSQYQRAKVGDLTKAISINDKFIYIKELFHNRGEDFSAAIRQLNECQNMEEAFDCLEELKQKFFWDSKSDAYLSFCDLLRRKYS